MAKTRGKLKKAGKTGVPMVSEAFTSDDFHVIVERAQARFVEVSKEIVVLADRIRPLQDEQSHLHHALRLAGVDASKLLIPTTAGGGFVGLAVRDR